MSIPSLQSAILDIQDTIDIRYVTVAGVVTLLYDHFITIADEHQYVWKTPHSITKYAFLINRYLVTIVMFAVLCELCNFNGTLYSKTRCQLLLVIPICTATVSCITANVLILHRVLVLWKDSKRTQITLCGIHVASACIHITLTVIVVVRAWPNIYWSNVVYTCSMTTIPSLFPAIWGAPLFFEFSTIIFVVYSALATPRSSAMPVRRALQRNGILFLLFVIFLRLGSVIVSAVVRKSLSLAGLYFVWAGTIMFFNHSFIRLRKAEMKHRRRLPVSTSGGPEWTALSIQIISTTRPNTIDTQRDDVRESYRLLLIRDSTQS